MKRVYLTLLSLFSIISFAIGQDSVNVTIQVNMVLETVDPAGLFIAGGGNFGNPGDNQLTNTAGTTYEITLRKEKGFSSFYTLTNGACPDYSCKENLAGTSCGNPANYNDRFLQPVQADTVLMHCFGQCTEDLSCAIPPAPVDVIFQVDMSETPVTGAMYVTGVAGIDNWCGTCLEMRDPDGDNIYSDTLSLNPGTYEYKFNNGGWSGTEGLDPTEDAACTLTTGNYTNRIVTVGSENMTLPAVCFNACDACSTSSIKDVVTPNAVFTVSPVPTNDFLNINFETRISLEKTVQLFNISGQMLKQVEVSGLNTFQLAVDELPAGVYLLSVMDQEGIATRKVIIE